MIKTIYLAGPVTNIGFEEAYKIFMKAEENLNHRFKVKNPINYGLSLERSWEEVMKDCIKDLVTCDAIVLLPGWEDSKGACLEKHIAEKLNMPIFYYSNILNQIKNERLDIFL